MTQPKSYISMAKRRLKPENAKVLHFFLSQAVIVLYEWRSLQILKYWGKLRYC